MATKKKNESKKETKNIKTIKLYEAIFFSIIALLLVFIIMHSFLNK